MAINDISLTAGMRGNLLSLQQTASLMERTQIRLSTGKKVNSPIDDPVNYFAAKAHEDRAADLALRKDGMSEAIQLVKTADSGIKGIMSLLEDAKSKADSALTIANSTGNTTSIQSLAVDFDKLLEQINYLAADAGYKGVNLLGGTGQTLEVRFNEYAVSSGGSYLTLQGFSASATGLVINDAFAATHGAGLAAWSSGTTFTVTSIADSITQIDTAIETLRTESKTLSSNLNVITTRQEFTQNMINSLLEGATNLTIADTNEEGANMLMLQIRQQLGTTSLSLASDAAAAVLRLF